MEKAKFQADLHCHTSISDGTLTPGEIVEHAVRRGLKALAITDHDTIDGWTEAGRAACRLGILLVEGIEINTEWQGREVHFLGYGLRKDDEGFKKQLRIIQEKRLTRVKKILAKLSELKIDIKLDEVMFFVGGESIGRPHVAQALIKKGYEADFKRAFNKYLKIGAPAYIPRYKLNPTGAIKMIREAGGVAVLAHPGSRIKEEEIREWKEAGLQGIEVSHPEHSVEESHKYRQLAQKMELIATGGSDYHGPGIKPGIEIGDWGVGLDTVEQLLKLMKTNALKLSEEEG